MTDLEHLEFIQRVIVKNRLKVTIVRPDDPRFVHLTVDRLRRNGLGSSLVGMSLAAWLADYSEAMEKFALLHNLSVAVTKLVLKLGSKSSNELMITALHLRSRLFAVYVETGNVHRNLLKASADLMAACAVAEPTCFYEAEAILSHGRMMTSEEKSAFFDSSVGSDSHAAGS